MKSLSVLICLYLVSFTAFAQQALVAPASIQKAYINGTRDISGKPGKEYWQNRANYKLKINFNPSSREIKGIAEIVYFNNSPDTLKQLWFKLYPNLYKKGVARKSDIDDSDLGEGVKISAIKINDKSKLVSSFLVEGTNMHTNIDALEPGQSIKIKINYSYLLNKGSNVRTGQVDEGAFFIAYFFPRISVYDDVDGWNKYAYDGESEFYNDFGDFEAAITVPDTYMVWATGDLLNAKVVFNPTILGRLNKAEKSDQVIDVVTVADLENKKVTSAKPSNTWKFKAQHVTDFAFAVSNNYVVKSTSLVVDPKTGRRTRIDAVFNPEHKDYNEVIDFSRKTVHAMSYNFPKWPYPYSHITVFDGLSEMEYPMMVNANPYENRYDMITLIIHEIFHSMFPFYVGINETKYGWMDEGWAAVAEWYIAPLIEPSFIGGSGVDFYSKLPGGEKPILTVSHDLEGTDYTANTYVKPTFAYYYLKEYLGEEVFTKAYQYYITQWQGKHPTPFDFFYCMNEGSGKNLNWFWKRWFLEDSGVDLAIKVVAKEEEGYSLQIENIGGKPLPINLTYTFADGSTEKAQADVGVWEAEASIINLKLNTSKVLKKVELKSVYVPDRNIADNVFVIK